MFGYVCCVWVGCVFVCVFCVCGVLVGLWCACVFVVCVERVCEVGVFVMWCVFCVYVSYGVCGMMCVCVCVWCLCVGCVFEMCVWWVCVCGGCVC